MSGLPHTRRTRRIGRATVAYKKQYILKNRAYVGSRRPTGKGMKVLYKNKQNALTHTPMLPISKMLRNPYMTVGGYAFDTGAGLAGGYVFSANGLFDPDITGAGHQPMGFDQAMLFYEHYCVTKAKITVNFYNFNTTHPVAVGILIAPDATIETNIGKLNENGMLVKQILTPNIDASVGSKCSLTITANLSRINGKKDVRSEDDFRGDIASNPTEQTYFHLFGYDPFSLTAATGVNFECLIEYEALYSEPRKLIQS